MAGDQVTAIDSTDDDFAPHVHPMSRVAKEAAGHANLLLKSLAGILDGGSPTSEDTAVDTLI